jgi:serine/threonine-protein kinase
LFGFRILEKLGSGGQGVVYRAQQVGLNREVALKLIRADTAPVGTLNRFWTEAESLGRLRHPNIVQVYDFGRYDFGREGRAHYLCMELLTGGSLADRLATGPLPVGAAAELVRTLADAVQAAHDAGVVHRDLKPSNILFDTAGVPKLADFGLAKLLDAGGALPPTEEGALLGTFAYMAPEQAAGLTATGQADIHALGVVLYEALTGTRPYRGALPEEILAAVIYCEAEPPSSVRPGCPRDLEIVCLRCLQKAPADRYSSARAVAEDLGRWLRGEPITPPSLAQRLKQWAVRKPMLAANFCAVLVFYTIHLVCHYALGIRDPENRFHTAASVVALGWVVGAALGQRFLDRPRWALLGDYGWTTAQVVLVTVLLWAGKGPASAIVVAYPLLVAAAALSAHAERLVWYSATVAGAGYTAVSVGARWLWTENVLPVSVSLVFVGMLFVLALIQSLILRRAAGR